GQVPMYALTVAKGGLKISPLADGACATFKEGDPPRAASDGRAYCGSQTGRTRNGVRIWELGGVSLKALADILETDHEVIDRTGVTDLFNIHLEYMLDSATKPAGGAPVDRTGAGAADVYTAVKEQLGLDLVSTTGPHEYVVIDRIDK